MWKTQKTKLKYNSKQLPRIYFCSIFCSVTLLFSFPSFVFTFLSKNKLFQMFFQWQHQKRPLADATTPHLLPPIIVDVFVSAAKVDTQTWRSVEPWMCVPPLHSSVIMHIDVSDNFIFNLTSLITKVTTRIWQATLPPWHVVTTMASLPPSSCWWYSWYSTLSWNKMTDN